MYPEQWIEKHLRTYYVSICRRGSDTSIAYLSGYNFCGWFNVQDGVYKPIKYCVVLGGAAHVRTFMYSMVRNVQELMYCQVIL